MGYVTIICKCGHVADLEEFCRTPIGGELPPGHFQCPKCTEAWKRVEGDYRILRAGAETTIIAGRVTIVPVERQL